MKMKLTFLLIASVFFVSCGMPTIFAPSSSEYYLAQVQTPSLPDSVEGKLEMKLQPGPNYNLLQDPKAEGPSLMFFYAFGGKPATDYDLDLQISSIQSAFRTKYINGYDGVPVSDPKEVLKTYNNIFLYGVNTSAGTKFQAGNQYVLYPQYQPNLAALDTFNLQKKDVIPPSLGYSLQLTWVEKATPVASPLFNSNASIDANNLYDYSGQPFSLSKSTIQEKISDTNNNEYGYVEENPTEVRIHLFSAFFISGPFSNYFWSELKHLGSIPITLQ